MVVYDLHGVRSCHEKGARLMASDNEMAETILTAENVRQLGVLDLPPIELLKKACQLYGSKPALGYRPFVGRDEDGASYAPDFRSVSFQELWSQIVATASGLKRSAFLEGEAVMGVCGFAGVDAVVGEFAALYLGIPCVHLDATWSSDDMEQIINDAGVTCLICAAESLSAISDILPHCPKIKTLLIKGFEARDSYAAAECARTQTMITRQNRRLLVANLKIIQNLGHDLAAVDPVLPSADRDIIVTRVYEPVSGGEPRVTTYHAEDWSAFFHALLNENTANLPYIALHHLPLSTIEGQGMVIRGLLLGGVSYFTSNRDLSALALEMRQVRPTHLTIDERLGHLLKDRFDRELLSFTAHATVPLSAAEREQLVIEALRTDPMSERLLFATAVTPWLDAETGDFVRQCLPVPVVENARFSPS